MKISINYPHLAAEFVIVFFGVAIALAADSWREDLNEAELERNYLERLTTEIDYGRQRVEVVHDYFETAQISAKQLISLLEVEEVDSLDVDELVELFAKAASIGGNREGLTHNFVFVELLSTGRLSVIQNEKIRQDIVGYFNAAENATGTWDRIPKTSLTRFMALTGFAPVDLLEGSYLSEDDKQRIRLELTRNPDFSRELRIQVAQTERFKSSAKRLIERNLELSAAIIDEIN